MKVKNPKLFRLKKKKKCFKTCIDKLEQTAWKKGVPHKKRNGIQGKKI